MSHDEYKPKQQTVDKNKQWILKLQKDIDETLLEDFSNYYWEMTKNTKSTDLE